MRTSPPHPTPCYSQPGVTHSFIWPGVWRSDGSGGGKGHPMILLQLTTPAHLAPTMGQVVCRNQNSASPLTQYLWNGICWLQSISQPHPLLTPSVAATLVWLQRYSSGPAQSPPPWPPSSRPGSPQAVSPKQPEGTCEHLNQVQPVLCPQTSRAPIFLGVKAQVLPTIPKALQDLPPAPVPSLPSPPPSPPLTHSVQPREPPHCSSNTPGIVLPQDLCTGYSVCQECYSLRSSNSFFLLCLNITSSGEPSSNSLSSHLCSLLLFSSQHWGPLKWLFFCLCLFSSPDLKV